MWASSAPSRLSLPYKEERRGKGEAKKRGRNWEKKKIGPGNPLGDMHEVGTEEETNR